MIVVVPTRGRPDNAARQQEALQLAGTSVADFVYVVDHDDPRAADYCRLGLPKVDILDSGPGGTGMVAALNATAVRYADAYDAVGFMGDDHLPRTAGWDGRVMNALTSGDALRPGYVVYGNDLLQGPNLPTAAFLPSIVVSALGYIAPPCLSHLYVDNFWLDLGQRLGGLVYLDDVVVEHMHPIASKGTWDEGYTRVNASAVDTADRQAWEQFRDGGELDAAVARVRKVYGR
jgi:hypothetical protein